MASCRAWATRPERRPAPAMAAFWTLVVACQRGLVRFVAVAALDVQFADMAGLALGMP